MNFYRFLWFNVVFDSAQAEGVLELVDIFDMAKRQSIIFCVIREQPPTVPVLPQAKIFTRKTPGATALKSVLFKNFWSERSRVKRTWVHQNDNAVIVHNLNRLIPSIEKHVVMYVADPYSQPVV